ncbi:MAG: thioredoxin-dependent thiol peroxidase [Erysipelotrichaceae bacterium]|nr:thioredoxin-dependent thiol peroxidase [Erysipelotrichaceae bacterium]MDY6035820.1 thioredoxin-dependent thiol peroxidase [Bulleidia sp.]
MLKVGQKAPSFSLPDQDGVVHTLDKYRGKKVILYFYPKDNTSGCIAEACSFRDRLPQIQEKGAVVLGVSKDSVKSHKKFETNHALPFTLLSDENTETIQAYDVWVEKSMYGRKYMGIERSTYLIDEDGVIQQTFQKVKAKTHVDDVVNTL